MSEEKLKEEEQQQKNVTKIISKIKKEKKRIAIVAALTIITVLIVGGITLPIVNKLGSVKQANELYNNRIKPIGYFSFEVIYTNETAICGCNYTTAILKINYLLEEIDLNANYGLRITNEKNQTVMWFISPKYDSNGFFPLNSTYENGRDFNRDPFFNNWTKQLSISLIEWYDISIKILTNHNFVFESIFFIAKFTIASGVI